MKSERKKSLYRALIKEHGKKDAYGMYGEFVKHDKRKCPVCKSTIDEYSEWYDTGYEHEFCESGCYKIETYGSSTELETAGFIFHGKVSEEILFNFEKQLKINEKKFKQKTRLFWKKKKSQKKRCRNV